LGIGIKICQEDLSLVMIRDNYEPFYVKTTVLHHAHFMILSHSVFLGLRNVSCKSCVKN